MNHGQAEGRAKVFHFFLHLYSNYIQISRLDLYVQHGRLGLEIGE